VINVDKLLEKYVGKTISLTHKDVAHNDVRLRWEKGDPVIRKTMIKIGENAKIGYNALKNRKLEIFNECINKNFDLRESIYPITEKNQQMIKLARSIGATAKFPGSGGAIIGTYTDDERFNELKQVFGKIGCEVLKMRIKKI